MDLVNVMFVGYKVFGVKCFQIMEGDEINLCNFDILVELVVLLKDDVIIDNGVSLFVLFLYYFISNQVLVFLVDMGYELVVYMVIMGGQVFFDIVSGFLQFVSQFFMEVIFVVWLNLYWGLIEYEGKGFEQLKVYMVNKVCVLVIVLILVFKEEIYGCDLSDMLQECLMFDEVLVMDFFMIMIRQWFKIVKGQFFGQFDSVVVL